MRLRKEVLPLWLIDLLLIGLAWWTAFWLRFNFDIPDEFETLAWLGIPWTVASFAAGLGIAHVDRQVWRYIGLPELRQLGWGVFLGGLFSAAIVLMMRYPSFPRSVLLLHPLIGLVFLGAVRAGWRTFAEQTRPPDGSRPLLIVGSLQDAADALRALKGSSQWRCVGIVSPLATERGTYLNQIPVLGLSGAAVEIAKSVGASTALIASPPGSDERRDVLLQSSRAGLTLLTMPRPDEWLRTDGTSPRKIELEDLLGRQAVELDMRGLAGLFSGQTAFVSGAGAPSVPNFVVRSHGWVSPAWCALMHLKLRSTSWSRSCARRIRKCRAFITLPIYVRKNVCWRLPCNTSRPFSFMRQPTNMSR